jgi:tight adherence protein B
MATRILEILLAGVVAAIVLVVGALVRHWLAKRREERERRLGLQERSSVLLSRAAVAPPKGWSARMDTAFERAVEQTGLEVTPAEVLGYVALLGVMLGGGLYLWRDQPELGVFGFFLGAALPLGVVWLMRNRYRQRVQNQLPDSIYLLARSLRAGLSLPQAIDLVAQEGPKPVAGEFARCAASLQLGLSPAVAVEMMADRLQLLDVNALSSTVGFYQTTGGNLPLLLDRLAAGARDRNQFRGQFWATTAQGRITSVGLAAAAPLLALGYLIFQPDHVQAFLNSPRGWAILAGAGVFELIGIVWVYRILKIDY